MRFDCRALNAETDCPTCPSCDCIDDEDCPDCHTCTGNHCTDNCDTGELCCDKVCKTGDCCVDADCDYLEGKYSCVENTCEKYIDLENTCGSISGTNLWDYINKVRDNPGASNPDANWAFSSINLTDVDISYQADAARSSIDNNTIFCCQDNKTCDDGFEGCCSDGSNHPTCCDVDDCDNFIAYAHYTVAFADSTYDDPFIRISVPNLYENGLLYCVDWAGVDFAENFYFCSNLRSRRTCESSTGNPRCQYEDGKEDLDFPCIVSVLTYGTEQWERFEN